MSIDRKNRSIALAPSSLKLALEEARKVELPWYRARAIGEVALHYPKFSLGLAKEVGKAAAEGLDTFQRCSAIAWEIFVLAGGGNLAEAEAALDKALVASREIDLTSCRAEALIYIAQSATTIGAGHFKRVCDEIIAVCEGCAYWRCIRAAQWAQKAKSLKFGP